MLGICQISDKYPTFAHLNWFRGRVARQRSAKPFTAVRICSEPLMEGSRDCDPFLILPDLTGWFLSSEFYNNDRL